MGISLSSVVLSLGVHLKPPWNLFHVLIWESSSQGGMTKTLSSNGFGVSASSTQHVSTVETYLDCFTPLDWLMGVMRYACGAHTFPERSIPGSI
ncbi:hypothetical protein CDAR_540401 [Caerostris darwini]|uniref:Uncharacterized protein n=1 Tax=Caerostris darwini TaxID=1538125 RepID=A0AAV4WRM5_9ARAC|nr:hypothetical protein CDAR_540401 [Caerostris darwini]